MMKNIKNILFATNLSPNCQNAFELSLLLAEKHKSKIVILNVIENDIVSLDIQNSIKSAIGESAWKKIQEKNEKYLQEKLVGKMSSDNIIQFALNEYCLEVAKNMDECQIPKFDTVVSRGNIVDCILKEAKKNKCDVIILGAKKDFLKNNSLGNIIKGVMRETKVPVIFVPPNQN